MKDCLDWRVAVLNSPASAVTDPCPFVSLQHLITGHSCGDSAPLSFHLAAHLHPHCTTDPHRCGLSSNPIPAGGPEALAGSGHRPKCWCELLYPQQSFMWKFQQWFRHTHSMDALTVWLEQGLKISVLGTDFRTGRIPKGLFIGSMQIWKKKKEKLKGGATLWRDQTRLNSP